MNIFEYHLKEIQNLILTNKKILELEKIDNLASVNLEIPPEQFNFDLSCNIAMILGKSNKLNPKNLAVKIKEIILREIDSFSEVEIAGPGFLNIKLSKSAMMENINSILINNKIYGSNQTNETYNIEFVSANPTGPMHVGHCRGAIYGDVLANLLKFNGNKVTKEYYINDYGNQIQFFVESVYLRIKEIKFKEPFPENKNLYPGLYIKEIAAKIIKENKNLNFEKFDENFELLKKKSLEASMELIKNDLRQ
jgi:arginyl-tRNA synthetase